MNKFIMLCLIISSVHADEVTDDMIKQLGHREWSVRDSIHYKIKAVGGPALHILSNYRSDRNLEIKWRVNELINTIVLDTPIAFFMDKNNKCFFRRKRAQILADIAENPSDNFKKYYNIINIISNYDKELCGYLCYDIWQLDLNFNDRPFLYDHIANAAVEMFDRCKGLYYNPYEELLIERISKNNYDEINLVIAMSKIKTLRTFHTLLYYYINKAITQEDSYYYTWRGMKWHRIYDSKVLKVTYINILHTYPKSFIDITKPIVIFMPEYFSILQELSK